MTTQREKGLETRIQEVIESDSTLHAAALRIKELYARENIECSPAVFVDLISVARGYHRDSITDSLTNLYNRRFFEEELELAYRRQQRTEEPFSVMLFDLDNFKQINDKYGHDVGDDVLVRSANVTKGTIRDSDILARVGGEEFGVLLINTELQESLLIADRIRDNLANEIIYVPGSKERIHFTVSYGLSSTSEEVRTPKELYVLADRALYHSKDKGKNRGAYELGQGLTIISPVV